MVLISLQPHRGNHQRFFPYAGILGCTPVVVQGVVKTQLQEDRKPLKSTSLQVKVVCYEAEVDSRPTKNANVNVVYEASQEVWRKGDDDEWGLLGDFSRGFRIILPTTAGGVSCGSYRQYRTYWQVEAVCHHKPIRFQGNRKTVSKPLPIIRYDEPQQPPPPPVWQGQFGRDIAWHVEMTKSVFRPGDTIQPFLRLQRMDHSQQTKIKKVVLSVHRHMSQFFDGQNEPSSYLNVLTPDQSEFHLDNFDSSGKPEKREREGGDAFWTPRKHLALDLVDPGAVVFRTSSLGTPQDRLSSLQESGPPQASTSKATTNTQTIATCDQDVPAFTADGLSESQYRLVLPQGKSLHRYALGETLRTRCCTIKFTFELKLIIKSKATGTDEPIILSRDIVMLSPSSHDRQTALAQVNRQLAISEAEHRLFERALTKPTSLGASSAPETTSSTINLPASMHDDDDPLSSPVSGQVRPLRRHPHHPYSTARRPRSSSSNVSGTSRDGFGPTLPASRSRRPGSSSSVRRKSCDSAMDTLKNVEAALPTFTAKYPLDDEDEDEKIEKPIYSAVIPVSPTPRSNSAVQHHHHAHHRDENLPHSPYRDLGSASFATLRPSDDDDPRTPTPQPSRDRSRDYGMRPASLMPPSLVTVTNPLVTKPGPPSPVLLPPTPTSPTPPTSPRIMDPDQKLPVPLYSKLLKSDVLKFSSMVSEDLPTPPPASPPTPVAGPPKVRWGFLRRRP